MKILIVRTFPDKLDLESYNVQEIGLAKALVVRGNQCDIVLYNGREGDKKEKYAFQKDGKEYAFWIYWMKGIALLKNGFMPSTKQILNQYDVIQVHEYDQIMSWLLYTGRKKPVVIYHGPYYHPYARGYNLRCGIFDRLFLHRRKYQDVWAVTKSRMAEEFLQGKGFKRTLPLGVGINPDNFPSYEFQKSNRPQILYVGKIEDRRNVYFLVEVYKRLRGRIKGLQLVLIGNGEEKYKTSFLNFIKNELESGDIVYQEKISQRELPKVYGAAEVFVFTSNYEIFGMVLLEAMYFELPIVSSMNGGASMLIENGENGYILEKFVAEEWEKKIESILTDKKKRKLMGQKGRAKVLENFTWNCLAEKFEGVYRQAIDDFGRDKDGG